MTSEDVRVSGRRAGESGRGGERAVLGCRPKMGVHIRGRTLGMANGRGCDPERVIRRAPASARLAGGKAAECRRRAAVRRIATFRRSVCRLGIRCQLAAYSADIAAWRGAVVAPDPNEDQIRGRPSTAASDPGAGATLGRSARREGRGPGPGGALDLPARLPIARWPTATGPSDRRAALSRPGSGGVAGSGRHCAG